MAYFGATDHARPGADVIQVLHVDDDPALVELSSTFLERECERIAVSTATDVQAALAHLDEQPVDCVVSDYDMPERDGLEFLDAVRADHPELPFILYTGKGSEETASEALSAGVTDYVQKEAGTDQYAVLAHRIENAVDQYRSTGAVESTERKRREVDLEGHAAVVENMAEAAYIVGEDRRLEYANERGLEPVQLELADIRGENVNQLVGDAVSSEAGADRFRAALDRVFAAENPDDATESVEVTLDIEEGPLVADFRLTIVTIDDERKAVVTGRDITERKRREAALTSLHEVTRPLLEQSDGAAVAREAVEATPDVLGHPLSGVWLYDEGSDALEPTAVTDAGRELVEEVPTYHREQGLSWEVYERQELMVCEDLLEEPDRYNPETHLRSEMIIPLGEYGVIAIGHTEPGRFDDLDLALARMYANTVEAALDRAAREARLREKHRELERQNERLDEFASIVSHDLRNPLSVAQGRVELIRDEVDDEHAEAITRAHDRMADLIEDILSLARGENEVVQETAPIHLGRLARRCRTTVATADATLSVETDRVVRADKSRLAQLLENLIGNAVEHGGDGVTVTVGELDDGFYVADDGVGIPPAEREQVFDVGYSADGDGTGFGLRIVEQVVEAHDWSVSVTESAAGGARFEVTGVSWAHESPSERTDDDPTVESETTD